MKYLPLSHLLQRTVLTFVDALIAVFLIGGIAVVASCVRSYYVMWESRQTGDGPYDAIFVSLSIARRT